MCLYTGNDNGDGNSSDGGDCREDDVTDVTQKYTSTIQLQGGGVEVTPKVPTTMSTPNISNLPCPTLEDMYYNLSTDDEDVEVGRLHDFRRSPTRQAARIRWESDVTYREVSK